jgi:hypothetical protein
MPLLDHFHPPLAEERHWESFHASWASEIMATLNLGVLPPGYFAETQVHIGSRIEVDVASFQRPNGAATDQGGVAVETLAPGTVLMMPAAFPDEIEVQVYRTSGGATLVGAIELVSPGNKDRAETRRAFAAKCLGYLQMGIGLLIVDIVTERQSNLHDEMVRVMEQEDAFLFPGPALAYAVAYRPVRTDTGGDRIEARPAALAVGQALPTMPLALRGGPTIPIDLEGTYTQTRQRSQL